MKASFHQEAKVLVIQTSFIGDVILATSVVESLKRYAPNCRVDFMCRKGNEAVLEGHPLIENLWVWDKKQGKYQHWWALLKRVRKERYAWVINLQRFASMGLFTALSGGHAKVGFTSTPFSRFFTHKEPHTIGDGTHEIERNHRLLPFELQGQAPALPKLYPSAKDEAEVRQYLKPPFLCIAPASVWFTKQYPAEKWINLIQALDASFTIYLLGAPADQALAEQIISQCAGKSIRNLCGKLSLLQSAALMRHARMNYVNDSAPLHLCTAVGAPVAAVFCSTVPAFGFTPLGERAHLIELKNKLPCRPCGLHGHKACPKGHFKCALDIETKQLLEVLPYQDPSGTTGAI